MRFGKLYIGFSFPLLIGALAVMGQERFLLSVIAAAAAHEMAHIITIKIMKGSIIEFRLSFTGAVISFQYTKKSYLKDMLTAASGPAAGIILTGISAIRRNSLFTGTNAMLTLFNLLPVYYTDGGRIAYSLIAYCAGTRSADTGIFVCSCISSLALVILGIFISYSGLFYRILLLSAGTALLGVSVYSVARKKTEVYNHS